MTLTPIKGFVLPCFSQGLSFTDAYLRFLCFERIKTIKTFRIFDFIFNLSWIVIYPQKKSGLKKYKSKAIKKLQQHYQIKLRHFKDDGSETISEITLTEDHDFEQLSSPENSISMLSAYSKDGGYVGSPADAWNFLRAGIKPEKASEKDTSCLIGFCEREQKWYGWGYGMRGFGIGSEIKQGHIGYISSDPEEIINEIKPYFDYDCYKNIKITPQDNFIVVSGDSETSKDPVSPDPDYTKVWKQFEEKFRIGRGEWTAKTLDDARQMAIDFCAE